MAASGITGSSQVIGLLHSASSFFKHPAARGRPEQAASEASRKRSQSNATPIRFSFRHTIWQVLFEPVASHKKREAIRNKKRSRNFERCAGFRKVPDSAVDPAAAELNRSGLQDAAALGEPMLFHDGNL